MSTKWKGNEKGHADWIVQPGPLCPGKMEKDTLQGRSSYARGIDCIYGRECERALFLVKAIADNGHRVIKGIGCGNQPAHFLLHDR